MSMPNNLVMTRHGHSEPNEIQKRFKQDKKAQAPEGFFDRHDSVMRLSKMGRGQAAIAGKWLLKKFPQGFDKYIVATPIRAIETAGRLALGAEWAPDDRWRERDWGEYGILNDAEREEQFALSARLKKQNKWYWCPPGGESLGTGVRLRIEDILDTFHRELSGKDVLVVTHGETMDVVRFVLERLTPIEWLETDGDPNYRVSNCQILQYSRIDPYSGDPQPYIGWRRSVCPWDASRSWNNGEWVAVGPNRRFSDQELLAMAEQYPNLL